MDIVLLARAGGKLVIDSAGSIDDTVDASSKRAAGTLPAPDELTQAEEAAEFCAEDADTVKTPGGPLYELLKERFEFRYPYSELEILPEKISVSKLTPSVLDGTDGSDYSLEDLLAAEGIVLGDHDCETDDTDVADTDSTGRLPSFITGVPERESAKRGIATHTVMQFCDFALLEERGVESELQRLCELEFISREDAQRVRIPELRRFVGSPLFKEMKNAKKLYRELRFNVKLSADKFTLDEERKKLLRGKEVLVQGVIDCIIEREDGSLHLIDYKTDRLTREEREDPSLGEERLRRAHSLQLSYYCDAVKQMFGKSPARVGVYSLHLGKEVDIPV